MFVAASGASISLIEQNGSESVFVGYRDEKVAIKLEKGGSISIKGAKIRIESDEFSVEADQINLSGSAIRAKNK